jgi:hypothetical protein
MSILTGLCVVSCAHIAPGERLILDKESVQSQYNCAQKKLPFIVIESHAIQPQKLRPEEELHHHFVYTMCPSRTVQTLQGTLERRISFQGKRIFYDAGNFAFKPGKWDVHAFIKVPPQAAPGTYHFKLLFDRKAVTFQSPQDIAFTVR